MLYKNVNVKKIAIHYISVIFKSKYYGMFFV